MNGVARTNQPTYRGQRERRRLSGFQSALFHGGILQDRYFIIKDRKQPCGAYGRKGDRRTEALAMLQHGRAVRS